MDFLTINIFCASVLNQTAISILENIRKVLTHHCIGVVFNLIESQKRPREAVIELDEST